MAKSKGKRSNKEKDMSAKKGKSKESDEAAALVRVQELKNIRTTYNTLCKRFLSEPLPTIVKKMDKCVQSSEDIDKVAYMFF
jgi:hypothetical protein